MHTSLLFDTDNIYVMTTVLIIELDSLNLIYIICYVISSLI